MTPSLVVLVAFGNEPWRGDGVARFAGEEHGAAPFRFPPPQYPYLGAAPGHGGRRACDVRPAAG